MNINDELAALLDDDPDACNADDRYLFMIDYLLDPIAIRSELATFDSIHPALARIADLIDSLADDDRTDLMLAYELCPMHHCDLAICADDDIAECSHLR